MKKSIASVLVAAVLVLTGTCLAAECNPCDAADCDSQTSNFDFGGWVAAGIYGNSHGFTGGNGPGHAVNTQRTDFHLNQLYLYGEKTLNTRKGFDFGGRVDFLYGTDAADPVCWNDETFDYDWHNKHGYWTSIAQIYGTVGYKNLTVKIGKFYGLVGLEGIAADTEFFYSHSYAYGLEPASHSGILAEYAIGDRLTLSAGWANGKDTSFENPRNDHSVVGSITFNITEKASLYYAATGGVEKDDALGNRFGGIDHNSYFIQSLCFNWLPTNRLTYVLQYDLYNNTANNGGKTHTSAYAVNNRLIYKLTNRWSVGSRIEWARDQAGIYDEGTAEYLGVTLGVNFDPSSHLSIRPEIRYDAVTTGKASVQPYGNSRTDQVSGGVMALYRF